MSSGTFDIRDPYRSEGEEPDRQPTPGDGYGPDAGLLVVDGLTERFGGLTALEDLSFTVQSGEVLGFVGPTGAGKSTAFNCISGRYPPTAGTVYYRGEDVTGLSPCRMNRRGLARTFQGCKPLRDRSVLENVRLALAPDDVLSLLGRGGEARRLAELVCERVGLGDRQGASPDDLSRAELVRLEVGRAVATDPDLLVADEPFAGLPAEDARAVAELLADLRDHGLTVMIGDHDLAVIRELIDRAVLIAAGSKLAEGTPEAIADDPDVRAAYPGGLGR